MAKRTRFAEYRDRYANYRFELSEEGILLMQCHTGEIELLPAVPAEWATGRVTGLRARGGVTVDLAWSPSGLNAVLTANRDQQRIIRYGDQRIPVTLIAGAAHRLDLRALPRR